MRVVEFWVHNEFTMQRLSSERADPVGLYIISLCIRHAPRTFVIPAVEDVHGAREWAAFRTLVNHREFPVRVRVGGSRAGRNHLISRC